MGDNVVWQAPAPADIEPFAYWLLERDAHPPTLRSQLADITQVILDLDTTATQPAERARADLRRQQQRPPPFETKQPEPLRILEGTLELQQ